MTAPSQTEGSGKVVIRNIGLMLSGSLREPILDANTVVIEAGRIVAVGRECDCDTERADKTIDARGTAVAPVIASRSATYISATLARSRYARASAAASPAWSGDTSRLWTGS